MQESLQFSAIQSIYRHALVFLAADKDVRESLHESFNLTPVLVDIVKHTCSSAVNALCMEVSSDVCIRNVATFIQI